MTTIAKTMAQLTEQGYRVQLTVERHVNPSSPCCEYVAELTKRIGYVTDHAAFGVSTIGANEALQELSRALQREEDAITKAARLRDSGKGPTYDFA